MLFSQSCCVSDSRYEILVNFINIVISIRQDLDLAKLQSNFRDDTKRVESLYAEMQEKAKQLLKQEIVGHDTFLQGEDQHHK